MYVCVCQYVVLGTRDCWCPHMMNVQAIDWTCILCSAVNAFMFSQRARIIWMNSIQHPLLIEVKWDCITASPSYKSQRAYAVYVCECVLHTGGFTCMRNINLCNVLILINFCWRCRKVTWMNRVYGNLHAASFLSPVQSLLISLFHSLCPSIAQFNLVNVHAPDSLCTILTFIERCISMLI